MYISNMFLFLLQYPVSTGELSSSLWLTCACNTFYIIEHMKKCQPYNYILGFLK